MLMINQQDNLIADRSDYHDRTMSGITAYPSDKRRKSTLVALVKKEDAFIKSWADRVPVTFKEKAVWEYHSKTGDYIPYLWGNLRLNRKVNVHEVEQMFKSIKAQVEAPAQPIYCPLILVYFFVVHCPLVYFITKYFLSHLGDDSSGENEVKWVSIKYVFTVVGLTLLIVLVYIYARYRYKKSLQERANSIEGILDHFNLQVFGSQGIRFCVGKLGSWVEAQFLDPTVFMEGSDNAWYIEAKRKNSMRASLTSEKANTHIPCSLDSEDSLKRSLI